MDENYLRIISHLSLQIWHRCKSELNVMRDLLWNIRH